MKLTTILFYSLLMLLGINTASAVSQNANLQPSVVQQLNVGVMSFPPFTYTDKGLRTGISYDIWSLVSIDNSFENNYIDIGPDLNDAVAKVQSGALDVVIGPIGLAWVLAQKVDYSTPYFRGEYVLVAKKVKFHIWSQFNDLFSGKLIMYLLGFLGFYFLYLNIFLWLEHKEISELSNKKYLTAFNLLLWKGVLSHIQKPPYLPTSITVRVVSLVWLLICVVFFFSILSGLTASVFSGFSSMGERLQNMTDMSGKMVTVYGGVVAEESALKAGLDVQSTQDELSNAVDLLDTNKTDAIYTLRGFADVYLKKHHRTDLYISPINLPHINLAFIFNQKLYTLLRKVDLSILKMTDNGQKSLICSKYAGLIDENNCKT